MALKVEMYEQGDFRSFEYPESHTVREHTSGVWMTILDEQGNTVALHKSALVANVYRTEPRKRVPVDTRMNHTLLARDSRGRFVSKSKASASA